MLLNLKFGLFRQGSSFFGRGCFVCRKWFWIFLIFKVFDYLFECRCSCFDINFIFESKFIRNLSFFQKPCFCFFLELSYIRSRIDINTSQIIFLIILFLVEFECEDCFRIGMKVGYVEIKLTVFKRHAIRAIGVNKISFRHDLVFVKLLHA